MIWTEIKYKKGEADMAGKALIDGNSSRAAMKKL